MQPAQKSGEPSMDEILASIRKIIAEDPSAPSPQNSPPSAAPARPATPAAAAANGSAVASPLSSPQGPKPRTGAFSLDKELEDLLSEPIDVPPAARPLASGPIAGGASPVPVRPTQPEPPGGAATGTTGLGTWFRGKPTRAAEPAAGPANARVDEPVLPTSASGPTDALPSPTAVGLPATLAVPVEQPLATAAPSETMQSILGRLAQASAPPEAASTPVPGPVKSRVFGLPIVSPAIAPASEKPATPMTSLPATSEPDVSPPAESVAIDAAPMGVKADDVPARAAAVSTVEAAESPAPLEAVRPESGAVASDPLAAMSAFNAAMAAAAAATAVNPAPIAEAVPLAAVVATPTVQVEVSIPAPAVVAPSPAQEIVPPSTVVTEAAVPAAAGGKATIEDTLADLMRPMVRQWLDDNMQRALEKAIRTEMADTLRKSKPPTD